MVCASFPNSTRDTTHHAIILVIPVTLELFQSISIYCVVLATLTKHATEYTTTPRGSWICLPPKAIRCQRRATTSTTPIANPVRRALPPSVEPTSVMIGAPYAIHQRYCSYRHLHQQMLYVERCYECYEGCVRGLRSSRRRAPLQPNVGPDCLYVCRRLIPAAHGMGVSR